MQVENPKYFDFKYQSRTLALNEVENQLAANEAVIEYFDADSALFVFTISRAGTSFQSVPVESDLGDMIERLKVLTSKDHEHTPDFNDLSFEVFSKTIGGPLSTLDGNIEYLMIVLDGQLFDLNFDILLDGPADLTGWKNLPYLFKKYAISYAYSGTTLFQDYQTSAAAPQNNLLAFSFGNDDPLTGNKISMSQLRSNTAELPGSSAEIKALSDLIDGDYFYGNEAHEKRFKEVAADYRILHLAIHGETNSQEPENSKLYFFNKGDSLEDGKLHAFELYNMRLKADLAVLSACNTGSGKIDDGEGIMTLGRAFAYAGVNSILLSRQQIADAVTPEIMQVFYQGLKSGKRKSEALREARITFLKTANNISNHPFYWSSFYILGDDAPVQLSTGRSNGYYWWVGGFLLFIIVLSLLFNRRSKVTEST